MIIAIIDTGKEREGERETEKKIQRTFKICQNSIYKLINEDKTYCLLTQNKCQHSTTKNENTYNETKYLKKQITICPSI